MINNSIPNENQLRLINSLQKSFSQLPQNLKNETPTINKYNLSSRGSFEDNQKMINAYICPCGNRMNTTSHSTKTMENNTALDTYQLTCKGCGDHEEISFIMMRKNLQRTFQKPQKRPSFYDYSY
ncbi:MAG: hypothetical protein OEZ01_06980 [Candidatus Heimdallarchaeota archaeon]|nr:hypothetical protein [Candidatus Heimdallarchaeota archaeon]MDH5645734.1 hypothetical protein [Candidatus Heimdallarchaeota archaeon]